MTRPATPPTRVWIAAVRRPGEQVDNLYAFADPRQCEDPSLAEYIKVERPREVDADVVAARVLTASTIATLKAMELTPERRRKLGVCRSIALEQLLDSHETLRERLVMLRGAVVIALRQMDEQCSPFCGSDADDRLRSVLACTALRF